MNHTENIVLEQYIRYCLDVQKIGIILTVLSEYFEDNTYDLKDELQVIEKVNDGKIVRGVWYLLYGHLLITGGIFWIVAIIVYIWAFFAYHNYLFSGEDGFFYTVAGVGIIGFSISWIVTVFTILWFLPIKRIQQIRKGVRRYQRNQNDYIRYSIRCKKRLPLVTDQLKLINELLEEWLVFTENWTSDAYLDIYNEKRETFYKNEYEDEIIVCGIEYEVLVKTGRSLLRGNESYDISGCFMVASEGHAFASERMRTAYPLLYREIMDIDDTLEKIMESNNDVIDGKILDYGMNGESREALCYSLIKEWKQKMVDLTEWRREKFFSQESTQDGK